MAAVARHVDHLVALGDLLHTFDIVDLDAVVDLVPEPAQHHFEETDRGVGVVRGNFVAIAQGQGLGFFRGDLFPFGLLQDGLAYQGHIHQALDQVASVGQVGADHRRLQVTKMHAQDALGHAHGAFVAFIVLDQFAQVDRRGELHPGLAAQDQDAQQAAQASGDGPAVGKQQLPRAGLALGGLAPEHADRNDLCIFFSVFAEGVDQARQGRRCTALVLATQPVRVWREVEERGRLHQRAHRYRQHRARQAGLGALGIDHRQFGEGGRLQDVEHRPAAVEVEGQGRLVDRLRANPEVQQSAQGAEHQTAERGAGHRRAA